MVEMTRFLHYQLSVAIGYLWEPTPLKTMSLNCWFASHLVVVVEIVTMRGLKNTDTQTHSSMYHEVNVSLLIAAVYRVVIKNIEKA